MAITKHKIDFDTSASTEHDRIGAYVLASDGSLIAATSNALHVDVQNASFVVTATDLDIRDLTHVSDSVKVGDGTDFLAIAADGSIAVTDNGTTLSVDDGAGSLTVDAVDLDIRDLSSASDSVAAVQSGVWNIGTLTSITNDVNIADGGNSITVDAADLDIRDLTHASDSIKVGDGTEFLAVNADGSINVVISDGTGDGAILATAATVTTTAAEVVATPLSGRDEIIIQNRGTASVYIGHDNTVSPSAASIELPKFSSIKFRADVATDIWMEAAVGSQDVRILEVAY